LQLENAISNIKRALGALNKSLLTKTYLVGESITLADIILASILTSCFKDFLDKPLRDEFKNITRWFTTCVNQPNFKAILGEIPLCEAQRKYVAPKKEKDEKKKDEKKPKEEKPKEEKPKKEKKKAVEEEEEDDGIPREEPKPKSKLDLLPPSKLVLDEWKRFYSNNETKPTAVNWFWEHFDSEGYSIWRVDYKYNEELTLTWQSCNLLGGFMNRLERARKYAFGSMVVRGVNNANNISGYFFYPWSGGT
jgi:elongation factor 1-gamma